MNYEAVDCSRDVVPYGLLLHSGNGGNLFFAPMLKLLSTALCRSRLLVFVRRHRLLGVGHRNSVEQTQRCMSQVLQPEDEQEVKYRVDTSVGLGYPVEMLFARSGQRRSLLALVDQPQHVVTPVATPHLGRSSPAPSTPNDCHASLWTQRRPKPDHFTESVLVFGSDLALLRHCLKRTFPIRWRRR